MSVPIEQCLKLRRITASADEEAIGVVTLGQ
jgi:hypothetical protein